MKIKLHKGENTVDNKKEKLKSGVSVVVQREVKSRSISARKYIVILGAHAKGKGILL